jgi:hypothetical protein
VLQGSRSRGCPCWREFDRRHGAVPALRAVRKMFDNLKPRRFAQAAVYERRQCFVARTGLHFLYLINHSAISEYASAIG